MYRCHRNRGELRVEANEAEKGALALIAWSERASRKLLPVGMGGCRIKCGLMKAVAEQEGSDQRAGTGFQGDGHASL